MRTINVATAFDLILKPGVLTHVPAGLQLVDDAVADHWFTKAHLAESGVGTTENAEAIWAAVDVAFGRFRVAAEAYEELLSQARLADETAGLEPREPPHEAYGRARLETAEATEAGEGTPEPVPEPEAPVEEVVEAAADPKAEAEEAGDDQSNPALDHDNDGHDGGSVAETTDKPFDEMTDGELFDFIEKRDEKRPHHATGRTKLLAIARKEDGAAE